MKKFEKIFRIISIIFIIGCCLFYGGRLIYYYNKLKPEKVDGKVVEYIAQTIKQNSGIAYENDGLYMIGGDYIFKGNVNNNYVSYSDKLWRIIKVNSDGTVKLVLDTDASVESYNLNGTDYDTSNVYSYLNNNFIKTLLDSDKYLSKMTICGDAVTDLNNITCSKKLENQMIGLIDINDFMTSILNDSTYFNTESAIWMINPSDEQTMWLVYENKLTKDLASEQYGVRPVIMLNSTVKIKSGKGTSNDPYMLEV